MEELLQLAIALCAADAGVVRLDDEDLVALGRSEMKEWLATMDIDDSTGARRGSLALFSDEARALSGPQNESLRAIAAQIGRDLDLFESQAPWWPLIDKAPVAIFCYDVGGRRFTYVNATFAETLGYTVGEVLDLDSVTDVIAEDQRDVVAEMLRRREAGDDREVRYITKVRCRDGAVLDAEIHSTIADAGAGRMIVGAAVDMTTQVASSRNLAEREEYLRALTDHLSEVIVILSRDCVLTYISPSIAGVLGYEPDELLGRSTLVTVLHPDDAGPLRAALQELAAGGEFECAEYRFRHKNGQWRTIEVEAANRLDHPQIRGLVLNLHDVTDRNRMERELAQLHRLTSLGRLAAQVAHEFNNVMMGIQPMVEAIRRRAAGDATLLRFTDVIAASLQRGKRITTDILRFGRPAQLSLRPVNVRELVQKAADEIRPLLGDRVRIELSIADPRAHVLADPAQLSQVLVNLAGNARDAMEVDGGTVTLDARGGDGGFVHISVADTGGGIAANDLPYIFEPFFTTKHRGTGLGLSVVFQVVAAHHGHISVDSEPEKGTTFHLFIPAVDASTAPDENAAADDRGERAQRLRVLIVDDEEPITRGLRLSLEADGFDVQTVATAGEVLPAMTAFAPDVVVLDLSLPDDDGRAVYQRIAATSAVPVIFSSGHATEGEIAELVTASRSAFLLKPYTTDELLETIHRLVGCKERANA